ncbi:MAG: NAD-dependent malic enzyme [Ilumatobacteraceae bacterium]
MTETSTQVEATARFGGRRGQQLLRDPRWNKSTAYSEEEREALGLVGLLPEGIESEDQQVRRVVHQLEVATTPLAKYVVLTNLHDRNSTLFYRVLMSDPAQYMPIVYTPTVGEACQKYDLILRRPRGMYLSINRAGRLAEILRNWYEDDVRFIVVTDGERILGLGDLGANGMGIPIGKLALYTACAGVPPQLTLPITLDVGTNNEGLLADPLYLGLRQPRVTGAAYDEFLEEFVTAVEEVFPRACVQFEDFALPHAAPLLERYRERICCFNDDIQGTAAVALAGILAALRIAGGDLRDQRFLFFGGGSAAIGIAGLLAKALVQDGMPEAEAHARSWLYDIEGLVESSRDDLTEYQRPYAHDHAPSTDFVALIEDLRPTALIGVSTVGRAFDRNVIEAMSRVNDRPIIFPLSNPTAKAECTAEEAYTWSQGRAVVATGSPFAPVTVGDHTFVPGQGNNVYIFPAMGLAVYATEAARVTDEMFIEAARALAAQITPSHLASGSVYPPQSAILATSQAVANHVAAYVVAHGLAGIDPPADLAAHIEACSYRPEYAYLDGPA